MGRERLRASGDHHPWHVRLLAVARQREPRVLQGAHGGDGRLRHSHRRAAHRDRARRLRGGDSFFRGARGGGPRDPVQDRRQGDRLPVRDHAELHGQVERAVPRMLGPYSPEHVRRQEELVLRCQGQERHEQDVRKLSRRASRRPDGIRPHVLADGQ